MSPPTSPTSPPILPTSARRLMLTALMLVLALAILAAVFWSWGIARSVTFSRDYVLIAAIFAGLGASICLAGAMRFINDELDTAAPSLPIRWTLLTQKRILVVAQLATTALAAAAALALLFNWKIPGT